MKFAIAETLASAGGHQQRSTQPVALHEGVAKQRSTACPHWHVDTSSPELQEQPANGGDGVSVDRMSQADVLGDLIEGNDGDAVSVRNGSGVNLSSEEPAALREVGPNFTSPGSPNAGVALRCEVDSYLTGPRGTLTGAEGLKAIDRPSCTDATTPPGRG